MGVGSTPYYGGEQYKKILELAYPLVKEVNPQAVIVAGAMMLDCPSCPRANWAVPWITEGNYDAVSFHSYSYDGSDAKLLEQIKFLRQYTNKPLYLTETALLSSVCDADYDQKAVEWAKTIKNNADISMAIWYTITPTPWECAGLVDSSWQKKPVYYEWTKK